MRDHSEPLLSYHVVDGTVCHETVYRETVDTRGQDWDVVDEGIIYRTRLAGRRTNRHQ